AREVGTDGKLGGQAAVPGVAGTWKDLTDSVNSMASNLTAQVRNIAEVTTAVARGDLSRKISADAKGEILELKNTINIMVDQLNSFASEVTRVAREVGTEGKLGGQAVVKGVAGIWKDLTNNVNFMASNLTSQVRNIAEVTTAVAKGDLSRKITVEVKGEILSLKDTINTMVDQLNSFASEVTRVAREVGTEGKLGGQAVVKGVAGVWKDLTDNVNSMASNLTNQVRNIAEVTTAVANGDLSRKITVEVKGEILQLKNTINTMVDQLRSFASEVTRVAREVGTEGKLGGQARVKDVAGIWKDLTDNVNSMANNLTNQVRNIAEITTAVAKGDLSKKITVDVKGEILALKDTINTMVDQLNSFASEVTRVAREVGTEGKLGGQAVVKGVAGVWKDLTDNVNSMASNLTNQVRNIAEVTTAVARGDLSRKITVEVKGEILALKDTINTTVDQLNAFASEVTRVAREVGTDGKLGGQAMVKGVAGIWKDLTDNVNSMASNLTSQVRNIAKVVTAVANGNLKQKLALEARGEIAALADTINAMIDTLATFADQVTTVAREVGVEGKLGGQARVPGATGLWRDLTDNVNQLAANLTTQVRAIADVSTAVTKGDLTQSITVVAQGEVSALKDNINEMIRNLRQTTRKNADQDWLKTNLAKFTRMLQGQRDIDTVSRQILSELAPLISAQHGVFYVYDDDSQEEKPLKLLASYAHKESLSLPEHLGLGEGLVGQCALEKQKVLLTGVPSDYVKINSSLGEAAPLNLTVLPVLFEGQVKAVIELASFNRFSEIHLTFLEQLTESIGIVLNTIAATMRTEDLLKQSQSLAQELQKTNAELEEKARLLSEQKKEVEAKNREIEVARQAIEEKAEQLALTSKYKSQFLANMSHELRTPLNSLLILARTLAENAEKNLLPKQVEFAKTIHSSGKDLLALINDILDLSKIESGTMSLEISEVRFQELQDYVERGFRQVAAEKGLEFSVEVDERLPNALNTDSKRLQQILRNLLSNALKFTEKGKVLLRMMVAKGGWSREQELLNRADCVLAFVVSDTGIGIPLDKQKIIFEAFQQVDMTTSRKYGGTGLGLSISREISKMLGGEINVQSTPGQGSTFFLYLPLSYTPPRPRPLELVTMEDVQAIAVKEAKSLEEESQVPETLPIDIEDDRGAIQTEDRVILVIEDDVAYAQILRDMSRQAGFKALVATRGDSGLVLAHKYLPHAITLDLKLPDMDGWAVFDRLKHDPQTRHIPIHIMSVEEQVERGLSQGAFAYLVKPVSGEALSGALGKMRGYIDRPVKNLLVVEDNEAQRMSILELLNSGSIKITAASSGQEALEVLKRESFDCMVLDLKLPDMTGFELIRRLKSELGSTETPIIVYTGKDLTKKEERQLRQVTQSIIVKDARSPERLLDEVALFMHQIVNQLPEAKRQLLEELYQSQPLLSDKTVLIVDDDVRNIFALTSVLERYRMKVVYAENGKAGLEILQTTPGIDIVLMDVMMPDMDGYETMRAIRRIEQYKRLPIIALTAKAMKGDREKCIEAGASDYIPKPVEIEQLLSLLRVWLYHYIFSPQ
ncbi:MAG: response regulator, partial [Elusimicrobia bacterium]|nr:response regulator [Elusimicrobiota bacterium]